MYTHKGLLQNAHCYDYPIFFIIIVYVARKRPMDKKKLSNSRSLFSQYTQLEILQISWTSLILTTYLYDQSLSILASIQDTYYLKNCFHQKYCDGGWSIFFVRQLLIF